MDYILDNGAFISYTHNQPWNESLFYKVIRRLVDQNIVPNFVVVPDIVGKGIDSLKHSEIHRERIPLHWTKYLCVQDGMTRNDINLSNYDGIFIGGTTDWKWKTAKMWVGFAHDNDKPCHIGRVGTIENYRRAYYLGADSVDGSNPSRNNRMYIPINFVKRIKEETNLSIFSR